MNGSHYAVVGAALGALALQIGSLHNWHEAITPAFVSGAILAIGAAIGGLFVRPPEGKP